MSHYYDLSDSETPFPDDADDRDEPIGVRCIVCRDVFRSEDAVECWTCGAWLCKAHAQTANGDPFCPEHWPQAVRDYIETLEADLKKLVERKTRGRAA